jgi:hypothetical protein
MIPILGVFVQFSILRRVSLLDGPYIGEAEVCRKPEQEQQIFCMWD